MDFTEFWDKEVKPLAEKCAEGAELVGQLEKATSDAEKEAIQKQMEAKDKKDWYAPWYISEMIFYVEHDLCDGRNPAMRLMQVRGCMNSEDYYNDVFKGQDCEEMSNYRKLGKKLNEAVKILIESSEPAPF